MTIKYDHNHFKKNSKINKLKKTHYLIREPVIKTKKIF